MATSTANVLRIHPTKKVMRSEWKAKKEHFTASGKGVTEKKMWRARTDLHVRNEIKISVTWCS